MNKLGSSPAIRKPTTQPRHKQKANKLLMAEHLAADQPTQLGGS